jgi:hypothetical protein
VTDRFPPEVLRAVSASISDKAAAVEARLVSGLLGAEGRSAKQLTDLLTQSREALDTLGLQTENWAQVAVPRLYEGGVAWADQTTGLALESSKKAILAHKQARDLMGQRIAEDLQAACTQADRTVSRIVAAYRDERIREALTSAARQAPANLQSLMAAIKQGRIIAYRDDGGREWGLTARTQTLSRVAVRDAVATGTANRLRELGVDLVRVSAHHDPCPLCTPWEDRILSLDGHTPGYITLEEAKSGGLGHHNCYHHWAGVTIAEVRDDAAADAERAEVAAQLAEAKADEAAWRKRAQEAVERRRAEALAARGPVPRAG